MIGKQPKKPLLSARSTHFTNTDSARLSNRPSRSKSGNRVKLLAELSLLDSSSLNRSSLQLTGRLRPSTTTHTSVVVQHPLDRIRKATTPSYSMMHSKRGSITHKSHELPFQRGGDDSPTAAPDVSPTSNTQRVPKKKKSLLMSSLEKGRGIDYFSLKPLKQSSGAAIKMHRSTSKKGLDEHQNSRGLLELEREPSDPMDATDLPLQYRPPPPQSHPIESMSTGGGKKPHNFKSVSSISSFSTFSVPPSSSPLYGVGGGRHSAIMNTQPVSSRNSEQDLKSNGTADLMLEQSRTQRAKMEVEWKNRYLRIERQMKREKMNFEKKEVSLRTEIVQLQQKLIQAEERERKAKHAKSELGLQDQKRIQAIKQATVKSLEPQFEKLMDSHRQEIKRIKAEHQENVEFMKIEHQSEMELQIRRVKDEWNKKITALETRLLDQNQAELYDQSKRYEREITSLKQKLTRSSVSSLSDSLGEQNTERQKQKLEKLEREKEEEILALKRKQTEERRRYFEEQESENQEWRRCMIKKLTKEFDEKQKESLLELQRKHRKDMDALVERFSKGNKANNSISISKSLREKHSLLMDEKEKMIQDLAFKLDTEETASAIIARRLASAESLSAQKDEIIHSMNIQLRDLAKLESVTMTEASELMTEESKDAGEFESQSSVMQQKDPEICEMVGKSEAIRKLETEHAQYVRMMEKKHKEELDALGCKLARLEAHYARITGDKKVAGLTEQQIENGTTATTSAKIE